MGSELQRSHSQLRARLARPLVVLAALCTAALVSRVLIGCAGVPAAPKSSHSVAPPTRAQPPLPETIFDVPSLSAITIDGNANDWNDGGLHLEVLTPLPASSFDPLTFDASVRLAWDDRGLLLLFDVTDLVKLEAAASEPIWLGDSIEVFLAQGVGAERVLQYAVVPSTTGAPEAMRYWTRPTHDLPQTPAELAPSFAQQPTAFGYIVEALLPWAALPIEPSLGRSLGLQLSITDYRNRHTPPRKLCWFPADDTHEHPSRMRQIRLAKQASAQLTLSASAHVRGVLGAEVLVVSSTLPRDIELVDALGTTQADLSFTRTGRVWVGRSLLPVDEAKDRFGPVFVRHSQQAPIVVSLDQVSKRREAALERLELECRASVFQSDELPSVVLADPLLARELLGAHRLETRWYDQDHQPVTTAKRGGRYGAVAHIVASNGQQLRRQITAFRVADAAAPWQQARFEAALGLPDVFGISPDSLAAERRLLGDWVRHTLDHGSRRDQSAARLLSFLHEAERSPSPKTLASRFALADERWWHEQQRLEQVLKPYNYYTKLPTSAQPAPGKRWPLVLFLHGSGERGSDLSVVRNWEPVRSLARRAEQYSYMLVAPQCPATERWSIPRLEDLLSDVSSKYPVDPERVYVIGASMGGHATWALTTERANWFAAAVPICGGGEPEVTASLTELPLWAFHGQLDNAVPVERSNEMVEALRARGGRVRYTRYPEHGHAAWSLALETEELYAWLLEQRRGRPTQPPSTQPGHVPDFTE